MYSVVKETSQIYYRENSDDLFDNSETIVVELASARRFSPQFSKEPQRDRSIRTFIAVSTIYAMDDVTHFALTMK